MKEWFCWICKDRKYTDERIIMKVCSICMEAMREVKEVDGDEQ